MRKLTVRIKRDDPERDDSPHRETYQIEADPTDRVLDVLFPVEWEQDDPLALRYPGAHGASRSTKVGWPPTQERRQHGRRYDRRVRSRVP